MTDEKVYTRKELRHIADVCYSNRWHIGKDYFAGLDGLLDVLFLMESQGKTVEEVLAEIPKDSSQYPV